MPPRTPFRDGFAALWHEPALLLAELSWRWCFWLSAWGLGLISTALFLDSLKVPRADEFLLRTLQPFLLYSALRDIFRGSLPRFIVEQAIVVLSMTVLWSFAAAAGRGAILGRMVAMFRTEDESPALKWHFAPILLLQLLRALWSLIALSAVAGTFLYGAFMAHNGRPLRAAIALSFGLGLACLVGGALNWYLGIAPLFCVCDGVGAREALDEAIDFASRHSVQLFLLAMVFFVLRLVWAGVMASVFFTPLSLSGMVAPGWIIAMMAVIAAVYFAGADWLHLVRLATYVSLSDDDGHLTVSEFMPKTVPLEGLA